MFKFLLFVFIAFWVIVFLMGFSAFRAVTRFFGGGQSQDKKTRPASANGSRKTNNANTHNKKPEKVFSSDEGEYVDFEEVSSSYSKNEK